jgi:TldD protein
MLTAVAVIGTESQERSYQGGAKQAGYEFIRELDLPGHARGWAEEAVVKCKAEGSPTGVMDLVLEPMNLALTMHESVGHPTELDRILGWEANMAGQSFIRPEDLGKLRYGSDVVNFTVDNTMEGGLGSWFYDDDGVKMKMFPLINDGILVNLGTTRETAPLIGRERSNGCCRSDGFSSFPINRIPNLYLEPGSDDRITPDDLIAGVDRGIYIEGMGSFSIDQMRNNFQFGGDMFWMIEGGKRTKPLKKVTYQSQTRKFWGSCDAIAGKSSWQSHGVMNCGKGEPVQAMRMTHGASFARFRNISVGAARL